MFSLFGRNPFPFSLRALLAQELANSRLDERFDARATGDSSGNDVVQDMIAPESAILASSSASGAIVYGAISIVEDTGVEIYAARRVPHSWSDKDNSLWTQRVSSRYCPAAADTATWQTYTVIG